MVITLQQLAAKPEVCEALGAVCDLYPESGAVEPTWIHLAGESYFPVLARDGAGGMFVTIPSGQVLYASSEGAAGVLADDLAQLVALHVKGPYWRDLLKYSRNGDLAEMRRAAPLLEDVWLEDDEDNAASREFLMSELGLTGSGDWIGALHHCLAHASLDLRGTDDQPAESLFGRHTIEDNPGFRATED
jgi:hypothetical protein